MTLTGSGWTARYGAVAGLPSKTCGASGLSSSVRVDGNAMSGGGRSAHHRSCRRLARRRSPAPSTTTSIPTTTTTSASCRHGAAPCAAGERDLGVLRDHLVRGVEEHFARRPSLGTAHHHRVSVRPTTGHPDGENAGVVEEFFDSEPAWSVVRRSQSRGFRPLTDRRVAQSDVVAPDGHWYQVAICRNLPWHDSSLLSADDLTLSALSAAALLARAVGVRGRFGWAITVTAAETRWRAVRIVYRERSRDADFVVGRAMELACEIQRGERPWKL